MSTSSWTNLLDLIYPVGSIYQSISSSSPASLFGGTWTKYGDNSVLSARGGQSSYTIDKNTTVDFCRGDYKLTCEQKVISNTVSNNVILSASEVQGLIGYNSSSGMLDGWVSGLNADSGVNPGAVYNLSYNPSTHAVYLETNRASGNVRIAFFMAKPNTHYSSTESVSTSENLDLLYLKPVNMWKRTA